MGFFGAALLLLFYSPKNNSNEVRKDIAINTTLQQKHKADKITTRTPHGMPLRAASPSAALFY